MTHFTEEEENVIKILLSLDLSTLKDVCKLLQLNIKVYYINDIRKLTPTGNYDDKITIVEKIVKKVLSNQILPFTVYPHEVVDHEFKPSTEYVLFGSFKSTNKLWENELKSRGLRFSQNIFYRARAAWSEGLRLTLDELLTMEVDKDRMMKSVAWNNRLSEEDIRNHRIQAYNWLSIRKLYKSDM